jgi:predicted nucleotidyltransferase
MMGPSDELQARQDNFTSIDISKAILPKTPFPLQDRLVCLAGRGSHSHGLYVPKEKEHGIDDIDLIGIVIPPPEYYLGLSHWERAESFVGEWDVLLYEYRKFVNLLLKQNPNVLGLLWLDDKDYYTQKEQFLTLKENRHLFRHKGAAYRSFLGYANAQLKKMTTGAYKGFMGEKRKALVDRHGFDTKNGAHLVRLLHMGHEYLTTGELQVKRTWDREMLLDIKTGGWPLLKVQRYAEQWFQKCEDSYKSSPLPDELPLEEIEKLVVKNLEARFGY